MWRRDVKQAVHGGIILIVLALSGCQTLQYDAYNQATDEVATDEAQLVEQLGHPVSVIPGWPMNFKITTADDFTMAQAVLDSLPKKSLRSLHPFADERPGFLQD